MNSGKGLARRRSWLYHPLEFGLSGEDGLGREALSLRLAQALGHPSSVLFAQGSLDPDEGAWSCLDWPSALVDNPPPGLVLPRLHLLGPRAPRSVLSAGREAPPVVVAGPAPKPKLPWGVPWFEQNDVEGMADLIRGYWDSQISSRPLLGLVLAGGRGGQLGFDKAGLRYGGRPQLERAFDLLSRFCAQTWISCRKDQAEQAARVGWPQIHDRYLDRGPLGGLLSALDHRPDAAWLVVACDQPYLDEATLADLLTRRDPHTFATAFRGGDGFPEPLCAVYEPKARLGLMRTWALGYSCPRKLLTGPFSLLLDPPSLRPLADVNTPREDEEARKVFGS